jgi:hypothetical protein
VGADANGRRNSSATVDSALRTNVCEFRGNAAALHTTNPLVDRQKPTTGGTKQICGSDRYRHVAEGAVRREEEILCRR